MDPLNITKWDRLSDSSLPGRRFKCGFCELDVSGHNGVRPTDFNDDRIEVRLCPHCNRPTFFEFGSQYPGPTPGHVVDALPEEIESLYREARWAIAANAPTAAVLACRKILMHVAVEKGDEPGKGFIDYVDYLGHQGFIPPNARGWVDYIRTQGNEANHQIVIHDSESATTLIGFVEALVRIIYELPSRLPAIEENGSGEEDSE